MANCQLPDGSDPDLEWLIRAPYQIPWEWSLDELKVYLMEQKRLRRRMEALWELLRARR